MTRRRPWRQEPAQATLELALSVPVLLAVLVGIVSVGRVAQAQFAVQAVAREAARACAVAESGPACLDAGLARAREIAAGQQLDPRRLDLRLDAGTFARGDNAVAGVRYPVPLLGLPDGPTWSAIAQARHAEPIERFRSRPGVQP